MCEWVRYFNINLYVPPTCVSRKAVRENICILFTSLPTPLFALLIVQHLSFSPQLVSSTLRGLNSGVTCSALFIIVYLERTCFIHQAVLPCPIDCKASVDWIVERGDGKRRERERDREWEKAFSTFTSSMKRIKPLCLTCCIDMKNIDF